MNIITTAAGDVVRPVAQTTLERAAETKEAADETLILANKPKALNS